MPYENADLGVFNACEFGHFGPLRDMLKRS
jgi:hypothetical protein